MKLNGIEPNIEHLLEILLKKLFGWLEDGVAMLPNIVIAAIVTAIFLLFAKLAQRIVRHAFMRFTDNSTIASLVSGAVQLMVASLGIFMALGVLNLDKAVASLLAGVGVLGLAIGFAFQEIASNFISGIFIAIIKPFNTGDVVEVKGTLGTVNDISLRTTSLMTDDGQQVDIPNKDMFTSALKNFTSNHKQRLTLTFIINYKSDFQKAREVAEASVKKVGEKFQNFKADVYFTGFADLGAKLVIYYWVSIPSQYSSLQLTNDLVVTIKADLQNNQIMFGTNSIQ